METVFRGFKLFVGALIIVPMLWAASCSMLGVGAVYAVKEAVGPLDKASERAARGYELRRHNEEANRRAGYGPPRDYDSDY